MESAEASVLEGLAMMVLVSVVSSAKDVKSI